MSLTSYNRRCKTQLHLFRCFRLLYIPRFLQTCTLLSYYQGAEDFRRLMQATGRVLARRGGVHTVIPQAILRWVHSMFRSRVRTGSSSFNFQYPVFPEDHSITAHVFYLVFPSLLSFLHSRVLEGSTWARYDQSS